MQPARVCPRLVMVAAMAGLFLTAGLAAGQDPRQTDLQPGPAARRLLGGVGLGPLMERQFLLALLSQQDRTAVEQVRLQQLAALRLPADSLARDSALARLSAELDSIQLSLRQFTSRPLTAGPVEELPVGAGPGFPTRPYARGVGAAGRLRDPIMDFTKAVTDTVLVVHARVLLADLDERAREALSTSGESAQVLGLLNQEAAVRFRSVEERVQVARLLAYGVVHLGLGTVKVEHPSVSAIQTAASDMAGLLDLNGRLQEIRARAAERVASASRSVAATADSIRQMAEADLAGTPIARAVAIRNRLNGVQALTVALQTPVRVLERVQGGLDRLAGAVSQVNRTAARLERIRIGQESAIDAASGMLNDASAIVASLPFSPAVKAKVAKVQRAATAALGAVTSILSGNPLGALGAIGSLFGGGPSAEQAAQERHQELMEEFAKVHQQLADIRQDLGEVKQRLTVIEGKLDALGAQLAASHREVMVELERVREDIGSVAELVNRPLWVEFQECQRLKPALQAGSYAQLVSIVDQNLNVAVKLCLERLQTLTQPLTETSQVDGMLQVFGNSPEASAILANYINPIRAFDANWQDPLPGGTRPLTAIERRGAFAEPVTSFPALQAKFARLRNGKVPRPVPEAPFNRPLLDTAIVSVANTVLATYPLYSLIGEGSGNRIVNPVRLVELLDPSRPDSLLKGRMYLKGVLGLLDLAIAQQAMLDGDILLSPLSDQVNQAAVVSPTRHNQILAQNVVRYFLYDALPRGAASAADSIYARLWEGRDTAAMSAFATRVRYTPTGVRILTALTVIHDNDPAHPWHAKLGPAQEVDVPLPSPEEFVRREFVSSPRIPQYARLRLAVLDALAGYALPARLSEAGRRGAAVLLAGLPTGD